MSRSNRDRVLSMSSWVMVIFGVGIYLSPRPRSEFAEGGSVPCEVRSWNDKLVTVGKYSSMGVLPRIFLALRWIDWDASGAKP